MTLVVALRHNATKITLVADSKLTPKKGMPSRNPYLGGALKLIILRDSVCVGVAGTYDPVRIARLIELRSAPLVEVLDQLQEWRENEFIVASLEEGCRLTTVKGGQIAEPSTNQVWIGSDEAFSAFQESSLQSGKPGAKDPGWRMLASIQYAIEMRRTPTVGGFHVHVATTPNGFRFMGGESHVGPEVMHLSSVSTRGSTASVKLTAEGTPTTFSMVCCPGRDPTIGACGYYIPQLQSGVLWSHEAPTKPERVPANSAKEFAELALEKYGQHLVHVVDRE